MERETMTAMIKAPEESLPAPVFGGEAMAEAIARYKELQAALDNAMSDQLMQIQGKPFRKKGYWRAVSKAFRLRVGMLEEHEVGHGDDWGYRVTYRAMAPNGDYADGDGACMRSEKASEAAGDRMATVHNIRSHAHTRAFNRAVSNLVGFGEVSADELPGGPVITKPKKKGEADAPGNFDLHKERNELGNAILEFVSGDKELARTVLKGITANDDKGFEGFNSTRGMKYAWQFKSAWDKLLKQKEQQQQQNRPSMAEENTEAMFPEED